MLYPVTVTSESFNPQPLDPMKAVAAAVATTIDSSKIRRRAATDEEFIRLVKQVLQSEEVRSLIHSLIARINNQGTEQSTNGSADTNSQTDSEEDAPTS